MAQDLSVVRDINVQCCMLFLWRRAGNRFRDRRCILEVRQMGCSLYTMAVQEASYQAKTEVRSGLVNLMPCYSMSVYIVIADRIMTHDISEPETRFWSKDRDLSIVEDLAPHEPHTCS